MKKLLIGVSGVMIIGLILAMIQYETQFQTTPLELNPTEKHQLNQEPPQPDPLQPILIDDSIGYSLQNNQVNLTYDQGGNWLQVPIEKSDLFNGEYQGSEQELIDDSFILTEDKLGFLYLDGEDTDMKQIIFMYSLDQGETWEKTIVMDQIPSLRYRKVAFLDEDFGYIIISADRTMSQEYSTVFLTHDGGESWEEANHSEVMTLIAGGGFIDEDTGFLSYGTINPEEPTLYVTQDGGKSWDESQVSMPAKYDHVFVIAETPVKEGDHLAVLINQGPNGDYEGGQVKGKFISKDNGLTWQFLEESNPNEEETD
ncbi:MAG TPA: sialidase family protein [Virgibacillus sp.]|nr:sialidase family protein [Virgibacillus sp.]